MTKYVLKHTSNRYWNSRLELVPDVNNAHNGSESEHVDDLLKKAGVKL